MHKTAHRPIRRRSCDPARSSIALCGLGWRGCASTGAVPRPFPVPGGAPRPRRTGAPHPRAGDPPAAPRPACRRPPTATRFRRRRCRCAARRIATAAPIPTGFDCSGFVQVRLRAARPGDAARRAPAVRRRTASRPGGARARRPRVLHDRCARRITCRDRGGRRSVRPRAEQSGVVRVEHLSAQYWASRFVGAQASELACKCRP